MAKSPRSVVKRGDFTRYSGRGSYPQDTGTRPSSLERDFLLLLDFDRDVEFYEEQPVKIVYHDAQGRRRTYTPDVLVRYRTDRLQARHTKPLLCEVKYREELRQHWAAYRPKFRAAGRYARQHGWRFRLVTDRDVRTPYLGFQEQLSENVR